MTEREFPTTCAICDTALPAAMHESNAAGSSWICPCCGWPNGDVDRSDSPNGVLQKQREQWARQLWREQHFEPIASRFETIAQRLEAAISALPSHAGHFHAQATAEPGDETLPLYSELGLDYTPLAWALSDGDWRTANTLTHELIDAAIARNRPSIDPNDSSESLTLARPQFDADRLLDDIAYFPEADLKTLAWLWAAYSDGRLGWAAQASRWTGDYTEFCRQVGWYGRQGWIYIDALQYAPPSIEAVLIGHLPTLPWRKRACYGIGGQTAANLMAAWLSRWQQIENEDSSIDG